MKPDIYLYFCGQILDMKLKCQKRINDRHWIIIMPTYSRKLWILRGLCLEH
ncbi:unknown [Prevotella sp. CAG:1058]|nr:unknown [Prevotella sp. CAG:1058]